MAGTGDIIVKFFGDLTQLKKAFGDAEGAANKWKGTVAKAAGLVGGAFAATKVVSFLGDATKAAEEDAKSQRLLATQLRDTNAATDEQIAGVEKFINKLARASGVADDSLRPAYAALARSTGDVGEAQEQLGLAMDIAAARGLDLETVTTALEKANNGQVSGLSRMGIATKDAAGNVLTLDQIMQQASQTYAGAAEAAVTPSQRWKVATDELKESIGARLLPVMGKIAEIGAGILAWFDSLSPNVQLAIEVIAGLAVGALALAAAMAILAPAVAAVGIAIGIITSPITLVILGIAALAAGVIYAYTHFETFRNIVDTTIDVIGGIITGFITEGEALWKRWGDTIIGVWNVIAGVAKNQIAAILAVVQPVIDLLHGDWSKAWDDFKARISDAFQGAFQAIDGVVTAIREVIGNLVTSVEGFVEDIVRALLSIPSKIAGLGGKILSEITGGAGGFVGGVLNKAASFLHLAEGGVVTRPTLALVGESGPEAVIPLSRLSGGGGGGSGSTTTIYAQNVNLPPNTNPDPQSTANALAEWQRVGAQ